MATSDRADDPATVRLGDAELRATLPRVAPVPERLGDFRLVRELGRGGMGVVYQAVQLSLDRNVAVKLLPLHRAAADVDLLRREAASIGRLDHPNIVQVYTFGVEEAGADESGGGAGGGGWTYFSMELVAGENLEQRLLAGPMSLDEALDVGLQVVAALEAAHAVGVVHRDIKPGNVLVEPGGRVRVADFGLAKWLLGADGAPESTLEIKGTPEYMSPEQAAGAAVGPASDIYSVGVLLYRMLGGAVPFADTDPLRILERHQREPARDLRQVEPRVPFELGEIVMRCLAKCVGARYASAAELGSALEGFREQYGELRSFLTRDGAPEEHTEALVLGALGAGIDSNNASGGWHGGLRYVEGTVLVADLENFLRLAVTLRPSNVTRLLEQFYRRLRETIESRQGTVVELFGDTVLAVFGDPIPLDDHAAVALDAALELRRVLEHLSRDVRPPVSVRVGLETGLLLAGYVDDGRHRRYHCYGDAVAVAHALERAAGRGGALVGGALAQATREAYCFGEPGELAMRLRGRERTVHPRPLVGPVASVT